MIFFNKKRGEIIIDVQYYHFLYICHCCVCHIAIQHTETQFSYSLLFILHFPPKQLLCVCK